ncbi:unnamed protein product [Diatraea saccharalis]|uniref:Sulfotransferase domain-containing protein n=1 Tax=Diatraea saccharalis TaxID=40085 RepID=A0A9N9QVA2_9NEOP|nr:unnamed protein product [Diatraea saccharalis]
MNETNENIHQYPLDIKVLNPDETAEVFKYFSESLQDGFVRIGPKGYFFTTGINEVAPSIYNMELKPDDTWVISFPKSGTTWMQELVWLVANDFDYATAEAVPLVARFNFIEGSMFSSKKSLRYYSDETREQLAALFKPPDHIAKLPRFIKSHLPLSLLPPTLLDTCKVVHIARDPRDIAVSYYHHDKRLKLMGYTVLFSPLFDNVKESWEKRNHPNMLFLFYEDALKDLPSTVKRVAKFLGKTVTEEQMSRLCDHLAFDNFKKNKSVNMEIFKKLNLSCKDVSPFIRKGEIKSLIFNIF